MVVGSGRDLVMAPRRAEREPLPAPGPRLRPLAPAHTVGCQGCGRRFVTSRFEQLLRVCPSCGNHGRLPARVRAAQLADPGSLTMLEHDPGVRDPLEFDDGVPYRERLATARQSTGLHEAVLAGRARVMGIETLLACMDFAFFGGSLSSGAGEIFASACEIAVAERRPLVAVCVSGGARMQEGIAALGQMARCSAGVAAVAEARLPYISVLADPCFGGVTASFAVQADVIIAEPGARIGFAGARVIEQATHDRLPDGFQTAEFLVRHGMIDAVVDRPLLRSTVARLLCSFGFAAASGTARQ